MLIRARVYPACPAAIADGDLALVLLASENVDVTPHVRFTEALADRLKIDLTATLTVMRQLPLWANNPEHQPLRRSVASFLAEDRGTKIDRAKQRIRNAINERINECVPSINILDLIRHLVDVFMEEVTGLPCFANKGTEFPNIFSSNLGIAQRRRLEATLKRQFEIARTLYPDENEDRLALRIGQWVMGRDALIGTLSMTLHQHLSDLCGQPLNLHPLPLWPIRTGVPVIGRMARVPLDVAGRAVAAGELVECRLDTLAVNVARDSLRFFGAGAHVCLGRPLAQVFFSVVASEFNHCTYGLKIQEFAQKEDDVFDIPSCFVVTKLDYKAKTSSKELLK